MNKIFIWAPKIMKKVATESIWICLPSCPTNNVFYILEEVGSLKKVTVYDLSLKGD